MCNKTNSITVPIASVKKRKKYIKERKDDKSRYQGPHQTLTHGVTNTPGVYVFHPPYVKLNH